jgi:hypothetical protein
LGFFLKKKTLLKKLDDLLQLVGSRIQGYKALVERLEVLLEEERLPVGRDREDQQTSERIQILASSVTLSCARLQGSCAAALNGSQVRALAKLHNLGEAWVSSSPHRTFVAQERVRVRQAPKGLVLDECLLLVFSDVLVLTGRKSKGAGGASSVLAQLELTGTELEDDTLLSWSEDGEQGAVAAAVAPLPSGSDGESTVKRAFLGVGKKRTEKSSEEPLPVLSTAPDMSVWSSQSPAFRLVAGEQKWLVQCADKQARLALTECILNQKYK